MKPIYGLDMTDFACETHASCSDSKTPLVRRVGANDLRHENIEFAVKFPTEGIVLLKLSSPLTHALIKSCISQAELTRLVDALRRMLELVEQQERFFINRRPKRAIEDDNTSLVGELSENEINRWANLYEIGEFVDSGTLCKQLGITRQSLSKAVQKKRMFWVGGKKGARWYPSFFACSSANRRQLEQVSVELGGISGDAKWHFFKTPKQSLNERTPLEELERGQFELVIRTAREYANRVFQF